MSIYKLNVTAALQGWLNQGHDHSGYWLTLDAPYIDKRRPDADQFEQIVGKFAVRLNNYCYGRRFRRQEKRLLILGSIEIGAFMDRPHAHLIVLHDVDMQRSFTDFNNKAHEIWHNVTGTRGNIYSNLVDIQPVGNIESRLNYALKYLNANNDKYCRSVTF